ncbi:2-C-methyl-D-erythritol 2,4-cyclodiphosphate synthase [Streptomyces misionensis JCM 4497]
MVRRPEVGGRGTGARRALRRGRGRARRLQRPLLRGRPRRPGAALRHRTARVVRRVRRHAAHRGRPDRPRGGLHHRQCRRPGDRPPAEDRQAPGRGAEDPLRGGRRAGLRLRRHDGRPRLPGARRGADGGGDGAGRAGGLNPAPSWCG